MEVRRNPKNSYAMGFKYCPVCRLYIRTEQVRCPFCSTMVRHKPRKKHPKTGAAQETVSSISVLPSRG